MLEVYLVEDDPKRVFYSQMSEKIYKGEAKRHFDELLHL